MPLDPATFALALEDWALWLRWESAYHAGLTPLDTHPALPEDRPRHNELAALLARKLTPDPARSLRATATFRPRPGAPWSGKGSRPLDVQWQPLPTPPPGNSSR